MHCFNQLSYSRNIRLNHQTNFHKFRWILNFQIRRWILSNIYPGLTTKIYTKNLQICDLWSVTVWLPLSHHARLRGASLSYDISTCIVKQVSTTCKSPRKHSATSGKLPCQSASTNICCRHKMTTIMVNFELQLRSSNTSWAMSRLTPSWVITYLKSYSDLFLFDFNTVVGL